MLDPYVYPGTDILKNISNIRDKQLLDDAEADYVSLSLRELAQNPLDGDYDVKHLAAMHKYIFQDIYAWAGKFRTINIEKEEPALGGLSIEYSDITKIEEDLSEILQRMTSRPWIKLSLDDRVKYFSEDLAALWKVHGFREGNTRLIITFCCQSYYDRILCKVVYNKNGFISFFFVNSFYPVFASHNYETKYGMTFNLKTGKLLDNIISVVSGNKETIKNKITTKCISNLKKLKYDSYSYIEEAKEDLGTVHK